MSRVWASLLRSACFWLVLYLAALELIARGLVPYAGLPTADQARRNPTQYRGYVEYLEAGSPAEPLIVLIGNSHSVAAEIEDAEAIYPARLDRELRRLWPAARLENWSSGGLRTAELELLSMKAVARGADLVVVAVSTQNFDFEQHLNLDFPQSDIHLLAGDPRLWRLLPGALFYDRTTLDGLLSRSVMFHSSLARSRIAVHDAVAARVSRSWHRWLVGRVLVAGNRLDAFADPDRSIYWPRRHVAFEEWRAEVVAEPPVFDVGPGVIELRYETFTRCFDRLYARLSAHGVRLVWIWHPIDLATATPRARRAVRSFLDRAGPYVEGAGGRCHDLSQAMPTRRFLSWSHLDEAGHAELARRLLPILADALQ